MKRYVEEDASAAVRRVLTGASTATSRLSEVEVASALCRPPEIAQASVTRLARHALRPGDAIQLASCV